MRRASRRNLYMRSFCTCSLGLMMLQSISVCEAVMMHASTLELEPRSLKIPAEIAVQTRSSTSGHWGRERWVREQAR